MSIDEKYLESGEFDPERNPLAHQIQQASKASDDGGDGGWRGTVNSLIRAVAVLEDQVAELRGGPAKDADIKATPPAE